jgi:hypothetical protein|nr:MAG TPA: Toxin SymE, type I toxin-antitoxin system [Caudoviricetes sp.]
MKEIERNIMFAKAGGNASKNAYTCRISLPMDAIKALGVTPDDRSVMLTIKENKVVIVKATKN